MGGGDFESRIHRNVKMFDAIEIIVRISELLKNETNRKKIFKLRIILNYLIKENI